MVPTTSGVSSGESQLVVGWRIRDISVEGWGPGWALTGWLEPARWNEWEGRFLLGNASDKSFVVGMEELAEHQKSKFTTVFESLTSQLVWLS